MDLVARAEALVGRIESGEFRGEAGRGVASITAEGETATVRYTDGSVSTLPLPRGPEGAPGRDGADGADGADGHTPALSWQGTALAVDGVPGPDLRGPAGKDGKDGATGPAPSIKIGAVSSGTTPSATIKGTSPDLTLDLVFAKGDQGERGERGAPGVVSSASSYVIVGPGRPDVPSTTAGTITGAEPVGAEYRSTDGAQVGAFVWMKRPGGQWEVSDGDTGERSLTAMIAAGGGRWKWRRRNNTIELSAVGMTLNQGIQDVITSGSAALQFDHGTQAMLVRNGAPWGVVAVNSNWGSVTTSANSSAGVIQFDLSKLTTRPWPSALPGSPA